MGQLIKQRFDIGYSVYQVGRYLKKWGFMAQKPGLKALCQYAQEVRNWLENEYPLIKKQAKAERAEIQWFAEIEMRVAPEEFSGSPLNLIRV